MIKLNRGSRSSRNTAATVAAIALIAVPLLGMLTAIVAAVGWWTLAPLALVAVVGVIFSDVTRWITLKARAMRSGSADRRSGLVFPLIQTGSVALVAAEHLLAWRLPALTFALVVAFVIGTVGVITVISHRPPQSTTSSQVGSSTEAVNPPEDTPHE